MLSLFVVVFLLCGPHLHLDAHENQSNNLVDISSSAQCSGSDNYRDSSAQCSESDNYRDSSAQCSGSDNYLDLSAQCSGSDNYRDSSI